MRANQGVFAHFLTTTTEVSSILAESADRAEISTGTSNKALSLASRGVSATTPIILNLKQRDRESVCERRITGKCT